MELTFSKRPSQMWEDLIILCTAVQNAIGTQELEQIGVRGHNKNSPNDPGEGKIRIWVNVVTSTTAEAEILKVKAMQVLETQEFTELLQTLWGAMFAECAELDNIFVIPIGSPTFNPGISYRLVDLDTRGMVFTHQFSA